MQFIYFFNFSFCSCARLLDVKCTWISPLYSDCSGRNSHKVAISGLESHKYRTPLLCMASFLWCHGLNQELRMGLEPSDGLHCFGELPFPGTVSNGLLRTWSLNGQIIPRLCQWSIDSLVSSLLWVIQQCGWTNAENKKHVYIYITVVLRRIALVPSSTKKGDKDKCCTMLHCWVLEISVCMWVSASFPPALPLLQHSPCWCHWERRT